MFASLKLMLVMAIGAAILRAAPAANVPTDVELLRDVPFGKGGNRTLKMHILRPKVLPKEPMPVLVWIHGGAWKGGSRDIGVGLLGRFAQRGYFCSSIEYRFSQEAVFPAQIEDCKCAVRFLRSKAKEYHLNPARIGVWGSSAGGHLAALLGTAGRVKELEGNGGAAEFPSNVQAVCDFWGPADFIHWGKGNAIVLTGEGAVAKLLGGPVSTKKDLAALASPITHVDKNAPPFLIVHGDKDSSVPMSQSEALRAALQKAGVEVTFHVVPGFNHGLKTFLDGPHAAKIDAQVKEFFDKHLKQPSAKGPPRRPGKSKM